MLTRTAGAMARTHPPTLRGGRGGSPEPTRAEIGAQHSAARPQKECGVVVDDVSDIFEPSAAPRTPRKLRKHVLNVSGMFAGPTHPPSVGVRGGSSGPTHPPHPKIRPTHCLPPLPASNRAESVNPYPRTADSRGHSRRWNPLRPRRDPHRNPNTASGCYGPRGRPDDVG